MTPDYLAAAADLVTQNQFNRLHIDLEHIMTPLEFAALAAQDRAGELPPQAGKWLRHWQHYAPTLATAPQPYLATKISDRLTWYRAPLENWETVTRPFQSLFRPYGHRLKFWGNRRKPVLVAFCGIGDRLFLPLPVVLQALPAAEWDVLKVTRIPSSGYLRPGSEIGDFDDLLTAIRRELERDGPRDVTFFGTSVGGGVALLAALRLNVPRCISISGRLSDACIQILSELSGGYLPMAGRRDGNWPDFFYLHGESNVVDRNMAQRLQSLLGGQILSVSGVANHNVSHEILLQGRFNTEFNPLMHGALSLDEEWAATDV